MTDHARPAITVPPSGIGERDLDEEQRAGIRRPLAPYTGRAPEALARAHAARFVDDDVLDEVFDEVFDELHVGWAGDLKAGEPHCYRLGPPPSWTGTPTVLFEYDNTQRRADHAHPVWHDAASDLGPDVLAETPGGTVH